LIGAAQRLAVIVCLGPTCGDRRGAGALYERLEETIAARRLEERLVLRSETCFGHCLRGPNILVCAGGDVRGVATAPGPDTPSAVLYNRMTLADVDRVIDKHLLGGMVVRPLLNRPPVRDG
jgi:(2Fe-2S) ferredoxin